jgi:hypothetical protein
MEAVYYFTDRPDPVARFKVNLDSGFSVILQALHLSFLIANLGLNGFKYVHKFHLLVGYFVNKIDLKWGGGGRDYNNVTWKGNQPKSVTLFF